MPARKKPCRICRRWFLPKPQVGDRQRVCSAPACQRERHRWADRAWHAQNPDYDRDRRLREKLEVTGAPSSAPLRQVDWEAVQAAVGLETRVVVEVITSKFAQQPQDAASAQLSGITPESGRLAQSAPQDAASVEVPEITGQSGRLPRSVLQDECDRTGPAP